MSNRTITEIFPTLIPCMIACASPWN